MASSGFKFHPTCQGFFPNDRMAYPLYEVIAEAQAAGHLPQRPLGHGRGMRGGGGLRLKYSNPMHLDDVAADFPDMTIIIAHPSWPWQDEALSVCLHKPNVYIDLSGWSPKYFPPQLVQYANTQLKHKMLFGSDYPLITPDRWIKDFKAAGFKPEVHDLILKQNAIRERASAACTASSIAPASASPARCSARTVRCRWRNSRRSSAST
jgi:predicted TIM-barrel fold metal-dependent hydrolase